VYANSDDLLQAAGRCRWRSNLTTTTPFCPPHIARSRATKSTLASRPSVSKCCGVRVVPEVAPTVVTPAWWAVIASAYPSAMTALPASKLGLQFGDPPTSSPQLACSDHDRPGAFPMSISSCFRQL